MSGRLVLTIRRASLSTWSFILNEGSLGFFTVWSQGSLRVRAKAASHFLRPKLQKSHSISSVTICWSKQVTRSVQSQSGRGPRTGTSSRRHDSLGVILSQSVAQSLPRPPSPLSPGHLGWPSTWFFYTHSCHL